MRIAMGADHAGYSLKEALKRWLIHAGHDVIDMGTDSDVAVDYPEYSQRVARAVAAQEVERGVLVCGSGIGMAMAANRFPAVRAAVVRTLHDAQISREHNDANVICFGARCTAEDDASALLRHWLQAPFSGGRHVRRVEKIDHRL